MKDDTKPDQRLTELQELVELAKLDKAESLAHQHVNWFLVTIKPLLIDHFIHGFKHGKEEKEKEPIP